MTEIEKRTIKKLWDAHVPLKKIPQMFPYKPYTVTKQIKEMRESGELEERGYKKGRLWVVELYKSGVTNPYEIAEELGYSISTVKKYLKQAHLGRKRPPHNYVSVKKSDKTEKIIEKLKEGRAVFQIAKDFEVSRQWVSYIKKREERNNKDV